MYSRKPIVLLFLVPLLMALSACHSWHKETIDPRPTGDIPDDAVAVVSINADGEITLLDRDGRPGSVCRLCPSDTEAECERYAKQDIPVCRGLDNVQLLRIQGFGVVNHRSSPPCLSVSHGAQGEIISTIPRECTQQ